MSERWGRVEPGVSMTSRSPRPRSVRQRLECVVTSVVEKRLGALPVAAEFLRRLDVAGIVDELCPTRACHAPVRSTVCLLAADSPVRLFRIFGTDGHVNFGGSACCWGDVGRGANEAQCSPRPRGWFVGQRLVGVGGTDQPADRTAGPCLTPASQPSRDECCSTGYRPPNPLSCDRWTADGAGGAPVESRPGPRRNRSPGREEPSMKGCGPTPHGPADPPRGRAGVALVCLGRGRTVVGPDPVQRQIRRSDPATGGES